MSETTNAYLNVNVSPQTAEILSNYHREVLASLAMNRTA
jgi:hypothetical protein